MKKFKHYALLLLAAITVFGCAKDYDDTELRNDISDLQSRVEKLETWCTSVNSQISALQGLVTALEAKDYVTGVSPVENGYTITFSKSSAITIYNGKDGKNGIDGVAPTIGVDKDTDGLYYWTIKIGDADVKWLTDANGNKIRTTGDKGADGQPGKDGVDGKTPVISIDTYTDGKLYWKINGEWLKNGDQMVPAAGEKGETGDKGETGATGKDGDSIFKKDGIDLSDPDNVTFTLNDSKDTKITLPRTSQMMIFDSFVDFKIAKQNAPVDLTLALNISDDNYKAIKAELTSSAGMTVAIKTRTASEPWEVAITTPVFESGKVKTQPVASITVKNAQEDDIALLKVTIVDKGGQEHSATRILVYSTKVDVESVVIDPTTIEVNVGDKKTLTATVIPEGASQDMKWTSSDETVATVNENTGEVTGVKAGTATITATSTSDATKSATCIVTVKNVILTSLKLENQIVDKDGILKLVPIYTPANATNKEVTWSSSKPEVATITENGTVTGKSAGKTTITVTSKENTQITATCEVEVTDGPIFENEGQQGINGSDWDHAYIITSKEQLSLLATRINGEKASQWTTKYYKLANDIDLGEIEWTPIGNNPSSFKGHFDGNNHTITGSLTIAEDIQYFGLFGIGNDATIQNLRFEGSISEHQYLGGVLGSIIGTALGSNSKIVNCHNTAILKGNNVGGIAGSAYGTITACSNKGAITASLCTGGITGNSSSANVIGCYNTGDITSRQGIIFGSITGMSMSTTACWNASIISKGGLGITGRVFNGGVQYCYWKKVDGISYATQGTSSNCDIFNEKTPTSDQISSMNTAWQTADANREYQFNATTGEIEKINK